MEKLLIFFYLIFSKEGRVYLFEKKDRSYSWSTVLWCRLRGHPAGEIFYNAGGSEPDHHCINCGDEIG